MATTRKQDQAARARRALAEVAAVLAAIAAVRLAVAAWRAAQVDRRPEPARCCDRELVDRVRTALGPLERDLDVPHVHVMIDRGVVMLHGDTTSEQAEAAIAARAASVPGVEGVVSKLHIGLLPGEARPSDGEREPSAAHRLLVHAAVGAGAGEVTGERAVAAVLRALATELGPRTTARLRTHLSADVASLLVPATEGLVASVRDDVATFYERIEHEDAMPAAHVPWVTAAVVRSLRSLVGDDVDAVAGALPPALAHLWSTSVTNQGS